MEMKIRKANLQVCQLRLRLVSVPQELVVMVGHLMEVFRRKITF